jgi:hypothetical protein
MICQKATSLEFFFLIQTASISTGTTGVLLEYHPHDLKNLADMENQNFVVKKRALIDFCSS